MLKNTLIACNTERMLIRRRFIAMMNLNDNNSFSADKIIISNAFLFSPTPTFMTSPKEWKCPLNFKSEYEDPYCGKVTRSHLSFSLRDCPWLSCYYEQTNFQGFGGVQCRSLDVHLMTLNLPVYSLKYMISFEWDENAICATKTFMIYRFKKTGWNADLSLWRAQSRLTFFTPSVTLICQLLNTFLHSCCCFFSSKHLPK